MKKGTIKKISDRIWKIVDKKNFVYTGKYVLRKRIETWVLEKYEDEQYAEEIIVFEDFILYCEEHNLFTEALSHIPGNSRLYVERFLPEEEREELLKEFF